jgi:hypothetical protein
METVFQEQKVAGVNYVEALGRAYREKSIALMLLKKELEFYQHLAMEFSHLQEIISENENLQDQASLLEQIKFAEVTTLQAEMMDAHRRLKMGLIAREEAEVSFREYLLRFDVAHAKAMFVKNKVQEAISLN